MDNIIPYDIINPVLVHESRKIILSIPEGGVLGFDGEFVYARTHDGKWRKMLTERKFIIQWLENGSIKRKFLHRSQTSEEIKKAYAPSKPEALSAPPALPSGP